MGNFLHDLRYAGRVLRQNPGFTAVAALTLAIGIGANTAIFSVIDAVLLKPLPYRDPAAVCLLSERLPSLGPTGPSWQNFQDWRAQSRVFESIAAVRNTTLTLTGAGEPERLQAQQASAALFPLLGVSAVRGHTFTAGEDRAGAAPAALISYGFWQRRFGGATDAIGRSITLDNQSYTITGILPADYQLIQPAEVVVPFEPWAARLPDDRSWHPGILAVGRLRAGASLEAARAEMSAIGKRLEQQYPAADTGVGIVVNRLHDQLVSNVRPALIVLLCAVGAVLLIACANLANLLLARASGRRREIAMRTALGAARGRLLRQLLTESSLLALCGGVLGVALAYGAVPPLVALAGSSIPNAAKITVDTRVLLFAVAVVGAAGILFGVGPGIQALRLDVLATLNEGSRGSTAGAGQKRLRGLLVVGEIAFAIVLLIGAGLLLRSFDRLQNVSPGFQPGNLLVADLPVSQRAYPQSAERLNYYDRILDRVCALPGVSSVGAAAVLPVSGRGAQIHFNIQGRAPESPRDFIIVGYRPVTPRYLETIGIPLVQGRYITDADTEGAPHVAVINEAMARQYFPKQNPIGRHVQLGQTPDPSVPWHEIVGVVADVRQTLAGEPAAEMYMPIRQVDALLPVTFVSLVLRTETDPRAGIGALRAAVREIDRDQPLVRVRTMEENISTSIAEPRFRTTLLAIFAGCALLLSIVGLYGVVTYSVTRRASEIGIRLALGAQRRDILKMILSEGLRLALAGVAIGAVGALALTRFIQTFLYATTATDPITYIVIPAILIAVALLACYIPARTAMCLDPISALRHD